MLIQAIEFSSLNNKQKTVRFYLQMLDIEDWIHQEQLRGHEACSPPALRCIIFQSRSMLCVRVYFKIYAFKGRLFRFLCFQAQVVRSLLSIKRAPSNPWTNCWVSVYIMAALNSFKTVINTQVSSHQHIQFWTTSQPDRNANNNINLMN